MNYKSFKIRLYPNIDQAVLINKTCGCARFIYNQMLAERKEVYERLKDNKKELYKYKYKTEKQYKQEFEFLKDVSSRALQQSRIDLDQAYKNFYSRIKSGKKGKSVGFPKFKAKNKAKNSYREPQINKAIRIEGNKIKLLKLGWVKFRGLSNSFNGDIKSVTVSYKKDGTYEAAILVKNVNTIKWACKNK